jgi:hypothetical protein
MGSPETPVHMFHYALRNNKDVHRSRRQKYGALLKLIKLKLRIAVPQGGYQRLCHKYFRSIHFRLVKVL